ncbi:MAG: TlpA family protein disulfide reductase [Prevotella sp.]
MNSKKSLFGIMLLAAVQGAKADSEITFSAPGMGADKVRIVLPQGEVVGEGAAPIRFQLKGQYSGYCQLMVGRMQKLIYIEDGGKLDVKYNRDVPKGQSRYTFAGDGAAENRHLEAHERETIFLKKGALAEATLAQALKDSVAARRSRIEAVQGLSSAYRKLEMQRQRYALLRAFYRFAGWTSAALPDVATQMEEHLPLWMTEEYRSFMLDALYAVGCREGGKAIHDYTKAELQYVAQHVRDAVLSDAMLSHVMNMYMNQRGADDAADLMQIFRTAAKSAEVLRDIEDKHTAWDKVSKGKALPDFVFSDIEGKQVKFSDFRGKYVLIDCWATWCGPCNAQLPHLEKIEERYAGKNIVFVSISSDKDRQKWVKMVTEKKMGGVQLNEPRVDGEFFTLFQVNAIPRFILLSPDGTVYDAHLPRPSDPALSSLLDKLL